MKSEACVMSHSPSAQSVKVQWFTQTWSANCTVMPSPSPAPPLPLPVPGLVKNRLRTMTLVECLMPRSPRMVALVPRPMMVLLPIFMLTLEMLRTSIVPWT